MAKVDEFVYHGGPLIETRHANREIVVLLAKYPDRCYASAGVPVDIAHRLTSKRPIVDRLNANPPACQPKFALPRKYRLFQIWAR